MAKFLKLGEYLTFFPNLNFCSSLQISGILSKRKEFSVAKRCFDLISLKIRDESFFISFKFLT